MHRKIVLFVDDEPDALRLLVQTFERDFGVLTASSGAEALAILRAQRIDLVVTDQKMPEMSGIDLLQAARADGIEVSAIVLSGYAEPADLIAAINAGGVYRYVHKPWDPDELRRLIVEALESSDLRQEKEQLVGQLKKRVEALSMIYEVSRQSASDVATYDAILDRVLSAVARVLPCDCAAALIALGEQGTASLRVQCHREVSDSGLLWVKNAVLNAHRKHSGLALPENRVMIRVQGMLRPTTSAPSSFPSQLTVFLMAGKEAVGTLFLFSREPHAYSAEDGELLDVLANRTIDSIQELRNAEQKARRRMEQMVESMTDGVLLVNEQDEVVIHNPAAKRLMRLAPDQALTLHQLEDALWFRLAEVKSESAAGVAHPTRREISLFESVVHCTLAPVISANGRQEGTVIVLRDVTEQKREEERKDEFVSIISHELRTPLTSISGALDLVLNVLAGTINEKQRRYLLLAKESTDRLNAVVDELLDLSKFAKGGLPTQFEGVSLQAIVHSALEKFAAAMLEQQVRWTVPTATVPIPLVADPGRLSQLLNNLLANALKFTAPEGEIRIVYGVEELAPDHVWLSFSNTGESIPEGDLERIFEKFEQGSVRRKPGRRGTGLGLAISRTIVEAHGGTIWAEPCSTGAQFVMVLPKEPPPPELPGGPGEGGGTVEGASAVRRNAVVCASGPLAYVLKALLLEQRWRAEIAHSPDTAWTLLKRHSADVLLLADQHGAAQLAQRLRSEPGLERTCVLHLRTARPEQSRGADAATSLIPGMEAVLEPPFDSFGLRKALETLKLATPPPIAQDEGKREWLHSMTFERELTRRLSFGRPLAVCHFELRHLNEYRAYYGSVKTEDLLRQTGDLLQEVLDSSGGSEDYLDRSTHEDFAFLTSDQTADAVCQRAIDAFDRILPLYYGASAPQPSEVQTDQRKEGPPPRISAYLGAVMCRSPSISVKALAREVAQLRARARRIPGSTYVRSDAENLRPA